MKSFTAFRYIASTQKSLAVTLYAEASGLKCVFVTGESDTVEYSDLELMPVGYLDSHANFKQKSTEDVFICIHFGLLRAVVERCGGDLTRQIEARLQKHKSETKQMLFGWCALGAVILGVVWLFLAGSDALAGWAVNKVPPSLEVSIGNGYMQSYRAAHTLSDSTPEAKRVAKIGAVVASRIKNSPYPFHFYTETTDEENAFAIPGGTIVVYSQLVKEAKSDDEIAAVLGHEIGHVIHRHSLRSVFHQAGTLVCLQVLFAGHGHHVQGLLNQFFKLDQLRYGRSQEDDADNTGVELCFRSGYDPAALIGFFKRLGEKMGGGDNRILEILQTHPMPSERIEHIREEIAKLKASQS